MQAVLNYLVDSEGFDSISLAEQLNVDHQRIVGAIKSIHSFGDVSHSISCL